MEQSTTETGGSGAGSGSTSTRPYLIRALHEWCTDNGFTPYIAVHVDRFVQVPMEYVSNNEIVLNVGFDATSSLELGNDFIQFKARFGGVAREIVVPIDHVVAVYARENGQGMAFPAPDAAAVSGIPIGAVVPTLPSAAAKAPLDESVRPVTPLRGLRLASVPEAAATTDASSGVVRNSNSSNNNGNGNEMPDGKPDGKPDGEPDGPASGGRPALKRIK